MTTAARELIRERSVVSRTTTAAAPASRGYLFGVVILSIAVLMSAFAIVYVSDLNRRLFINYQDQQAQQNQLYVEWGRLLLEQSTWSTQARVQSIAQTRLGMEIPSPDQVTIIKD